MKKINFNSDELRSYVFDGDTMLYRLEGELFAAEDAEAEAERFYDEVETDDAWNALTAATNERKRIQHAMDDLRKLTEALYSAAIALDNLSAENEQVLKDMGLL